MNGKIDYVMKLLIWPIVATIGCAMTLSCASSRVDLAEQARQDSILIHDSLLKEFYSFTTADFNFCDIHGHVKTMNVIKDKENGVYGDVGSYLFSKTGLIVSHPILHIDEDIPEGVSHVEESNYVERDKVGRISGNAYSDYKWKDNMLVSEDFSFQGDRVKYDYIYDRQERKGYSYQEWKDMDDEPYLKRKILYKDVKYDEHGNWVSHIDNGALIKRAITYYDEPNYDSLIVQCNRDTTICKEENDSIRIALKMQFIKDKIRESDSLECVNFTSKDLAFFEVHGMVKTIKKFRQAETIMFNRAGELILEDGRRPFLDPGEEDYENAYYDRDKDGYISSWGDFEYRIGYEWKDGKVFSETGWDVEALMNVEFVYHYDSDGRLIKKGKDTYTYDSFDKYGNWTKRTIKSEGYTNTETRIITYYKIFPFK